MVMPALKDPNHVLARLRQALTPDGVPRLTRELLAKRVKVSPSTIREIETGGFQLTPAMAAQIGYSVGADPESLLRDDHPLLGLDGRPLSHESPALLHNIWSCQKSETLEILLHCILAVADEKPGVAVQVGLSFAQWAREASEKFGLDNAIFDELKWKIKPGFDPLLVPRRLWADQIKHLPIFDQIRINAAFLPKNQDGTIKRSSGKPQRSKRKKAA